MELSDVLDLLLKPFEAFTDPSDRLSLIYQFSALVIAIGVYVFTRAREGKLEAAGLIRWLLPADVLRHPSAQVDFAYFFLNRILQAAIYGSIMVTTPPVANATTAALTWAFAPPGPGLEPSLWIAVLVTVFFLAVLDFALWFMHYIYHVVPFLWEYHKVHHSAEVMTPITAARMHPVEEITDSIVATAALGLSYGVLSYFIGPATIMLTIFEINVLLAVFFIAAFNLRHSHVWVRYPTWLQHVFICPAQHQIHHSTAKRHWDKNMGFVFALWDWAAGTLYAPKGKEEITFGLGTEEDGTWHSLGALYFRPFRQSFALLARGGRRRIGDAAPQDEAKARYPSA